MGILQVSPSNAYVGLTRAEGAERGEPEKYYPTNVRTFGVKLGGRRVLRAHNAASIARAVRRSRADTLLYAALPENGAARLWRAVHRRNPRLALFGSDAMAEPTFTRRLSPGAARRTLVTSPILDPAAYGVLKVSRRGWPAYDRTIDSSG